MVASLDCIILNNTIDSIDKNYSATYILMAKGIIQQNY